MRKGAFTRRWFKEIPDFPGYWINKKARLYSMKTKKFLVPFNNIKFYPRVDLFNAAGRSRFFVHRLVAIVWVPNPDPKNKIEVNHNDFNVGNPHAINLVWMTSSENKKYNRHKPWRGVNKDKTPCPF